MSDITPEKIRQFLGLDLGENDSGQPTARGYLLALAREVWTVGEGFSGKRPFGNSSWEYDLYTPMVKAGLIDGALDSDGYIDRVDKSQGNALVLAALDALAAPADEDTPGSDPATVIIVTEAPVSGRAPVERHYAAIQWDDSGPGLRLIRAGRTIAGYGAGTWLSVREADAELPDATARALGIARKALSEIVKRSDDGGEQPFGRPEIGGIASTALNDIWTETEL